MYVYIHFPGLHMCKYICIFAHTYTKYCIYVLAHVFISMHPYIYLHMYAYAHTYIYM